jgi:hypothetical protein
MDKHDQMIREHWEKTLWTYFANIILGAWLLCIPSLVAPSSASLGLSDTVSGILILAPGVIALHPRGDFGGRWGVCLVGIWLLFAPLVF